MTDDGDLTSSRGGLPRGASPSRPPSADGLGRFRSYRARRRVKKAARSKLRRRLTRSGLSLALVIVLILGGTAFYIQDRLGEIGHLNGVNVKPIATNGPAAGADDILLVGSTDRCLVKPAKNFEAWVKQCAEGVNGNNSDVIMILRLVPGRVPTLLSIPRDTFVPDARAGGLSNKVDAALADGPSQLIQAIEEDFGIPINHFVVLNFETFTNIVSALGGITMYFPTSLMDSDSGLYISHKGCIRISGAEALALVRARHMYYDYDKTTHTWLGYDPTGDLGRIERDHIFLKVLGAKIEARGLGNPIVDGNLLSSIAPNLTVDSSFSTSTMLHLIVDYHSKAALTPELTLPIVEDAATYYYKGFDYGDVVFPTEPQDQQAVDQFMGGKPIGADVTPSSISVSVQDAADAPAATSTFEAELSADGFRTTDAGSVTPVGPISETTIFYSGPGGLVKAERLLRSLTGAVVLAEGPTVGGADVTVRMGSDVAVAEPTARTASTQLSAGSGAPLVATLLAAMISATPSAPALFTDASDSVLAPPTSASSAIPSYDPRACPAKK